MYKLVLFTFVLAFALFTNTHVSASQDVVRLKADLTGAAEVPGPGDTDGKGTADITLNPTKGEVCFELTVKDIQEATAAHIHEGAAGVAGGVKAPLDAPKTGSAKGCKPVDAAVIKAIAANPANYYVNVHNAEFPKGAIRGQLSK